MSAPDTNVEKQEKQHKPALLGIKGAIIFGVLMMVIALFVVVNNAQEGEIAPDLSNSSEGASESTVAPVDPVATGTNESN